MYLRPGTREHFLDKLAAMWPDLVPMYERLYAGCAYLPKAHVEPVRNAVGDLVRRFDVTDSRVLRIAPRHDPPPFEQLALILSVDVEAISARAA